MSNPFAPRFRNPLPPTEDGFSLVEVLVALTILGLVLSALFQVFSGGLRNVAAADHYVRAAAIADSKLAAVGQEIPLEAGKASRGRDGDYAWSVAITAYNDPKDAEGSDTTKVQLFKVAISVRWPHILGERQVVIDTLMNGGEP